MWLGWNTQTCTDRFTQYVSQQMMHIIKAHILEKSPSSTCWRTSVCWCLPFPSLSKHHPDIKSFNTYITHSPVFKVHPPSVKYTILYLHIWAMNLKWVQKCRNIIYVLSWKTLFLHFVPADKQYNGCVLDQFSIIHYTCNNVSLLPGWLPRPELL